MGPLRTGDALPACAPLLPERNKAECAKPSSNPHASPPRSRGKRTAALVRLCSNNYIPGTLLPKCPASNLNVAGTHVFSLNPNQPFFWCVSLHETGIVQLTPTWNLTYPPPWSSLLPSLSCLTLPSQGRSTILVDTLINSYQTASLTSNLSSKSFYLPPTNQRP